MSDLTEDPSFGQNKRGSEKNPFYMEYIYFLRGNNTGYIGKANSMMYIQIFLVFSSLLSSHITLEGYYSNGTHICVKLFLRFHYIAF